MNISDIPAEFADMQIPLKQAMEEAIFVRDSYLAEIEEYADAETFAKIKAGVEKRQVARTLAKLDELTDAINELNGVDTAPDDFKATVTNLAEYFRNKQ